MPIKLKLRKPTPKALKVFKKHKLLSDGKEKTSEFQARLDLFMNEEALKEVLDVTFANQFTDEEFENLDLQAVGGGIEDFFVSLFVPSGRSGKPNKPS